MFADADDDKESAKVGWVPVCKGSRNEKGRFEVPPDRPSALVVAPVTNNANVPAILSDMLRNARVVDNQHVFVSVLVVGGFVSVRL